MVHCFALGKSLSLHFVQWTHLKCDVFLNTDWWTALGPPVHYEWWLQFVLADAFMTVKNRVVVFLRILQCMCLSRGTWEVFRAGWFGVDLQDFVRSILESFGFHKPGSWVGQIDQQRCFHKAVVGQGPLWVLKTQIASSNTTAVLTTEVLHTCNTRCCSYVIG